MSEIYNVSVTVVENILAVSQEEAVSKLARLLDRAGFTTMPDQGYSNAFLAEDGTELSEIGWQS
jgi:hypothetical protein